MKIKTIYIVSSYHQFKDGGFYYGVDDAFPSEDLAISFINRKMNQFLKGEGIDLNYLNKMSLGSRTVYTGIEGTVCFEDHTMHINNSLHIYRIDKCMDPHCILDLDDNNTKE